MRLRFVYRRAGPSLLVADNARLTKRGRAAANIGRSKAVHPDTAVTVRKRLGAEGAAQKWIRALPQLVLRQWPA